MIKKEWGQVLNKRMGSGLEWRTDQRKNQAVRHSRPDPILLFFKAKSSAAERIQ